MNSKFHTAFTLPLAIVVATTSFSAFAGTTNGLSARAWTTLKKLDTNNDKKLTGSELNRAPISIRQYLSEGRFSTIDKNNDGTISETEVTSTDDGVWSRTWKATGERNDDGTTSWTGSHTDAKGNEHTWTGTSDRDQTRNDDGTKTIEKEWERILDDGTVISGEVTKIVEKTEDGRTWTAEGTRTGPNGESTWTGEGEATRTEDGVEWTGSREGTNAKGTDWSSTTEGQGQKTEDGFKWSSSTDRENENGRQSTTEREGSRQRTEDGVAVERDRTTTVLERGEREREDKKSKVRDAVNARKEALSKREKSSSKSRASFEKKPSSKTSRSGKLSKRR